MSKYTRLNKINHYHDSSGLATSQTTTTTLLKESQRSRTSPLRNLTIIANPPANTCKQPPSPASSTSIITSNKMKNYNLKLAFFTFISISLLLLLVCLSGVHTLNCYHCSSVDDPGCDEPFSGRANYTDTDCSKHLKADQATKVCRKIVQYIEHKKVVIRSCGFIDEHEDKDKKPMCYKRSGTFAIMMESCNCYEDNCNHSASLVPNRSVLLLLAASCSTLLFYYYSVGGYGDESSRRHKGSR